MVYGATGFVGKLTAEYLARAATPASRWPAGQPNACLPSPTALGQSAQSWAVVTADAASPSTLQPSWHPGHRSSSAPTPVGPYMRYGLPLVAACVRRAGPPRPRSSARASTLPQAGRRHRCPHRARLRFRLNTIGSERVCPLPCSAQKDGAGELTETDFVVRSMAGGLSGGTIASLLEVLRTVSADKELRRQFVDPYTLSPDRGAQTGRGSAAHLPWRRGGQIAPELNGVWTGGFMMAPGAESCAQQRIAGLGVRQRIPVQRKHEPYCHGGAGRIGCHQRRRQRDVRIGQPLLPAAATRGLVERVVPKPGTGPSEATRERGYYKVETYTTAKQRRPIRSAHGTGRLIRAIRRPRCCWASSGLALATIRDELSELRGVLTPAAAMGNALLARFPAAGVSLQTERSD